MQFPASRDELVELAGDRSVRFGNAHLHLGQALREIPRDRFEDKAELLRALQETVPDETSLY